MPASHHSKLPAPSHRRAGHRHAKAPAAEKAADAPTAKVAPATQVPPAQTTAVADNDVSADVEPAASDLQQAQPEPAATLQAEAPPREDGVSGEDSDNIKVAVRVRPLNEREMASGVSSCVEQLDGAQLKLCTPKHHRSHKPMYTFTYDYSFWSCDPQDPRYAGQETVYDAVGGPVVRSAFAGINACVLAYGQTGTGKTHTMMGADDGTDEDRGLIPRICEAIFARGEADGGGTTVEVSFFEIYKEGVYDLLTPGTAKRSGEVSRPALRVREHAVLGPYVEGLAALAVRDFSQVSEVIERGKVNRHVAETKMNHASSRSHAVLMLKCSVNAGDDTTPTLSSKVALVDLAGSERQKDTGARGAQLAEGAQINKSLSALGAVIHRLSERPKARNPVHVPYRDSTLTWVLKEFLGGNARTTMVATVSPDPNAFEETHSTLSYVSRARHIVNKAVVNEDTTARMIRELREHVRELELQLQGASGGAAASGGGAATASGGDDGRIDQDHADEIARQLVMTEEAVHVATRPWEERLAESDRHLADMNTWKEHADHELAENRRAIAHERWRFAEQAAERAAQSKRLAQERWCVAEKAAESEVHEQREHELLSKSRAALTERVLELEAELEAARAAAAAAASAAKATGANGTGDANDGASDGADGALCSKCGGSVGSHGEAAAAAAGADVPDKFKSAIDETKAGLKRLNKLMILLQDQFARVEETEGAGSATHRSILENLHSIEASSHRLNGLLCAPRSRFHEDLSEDTMCHLRRLPPPRNAKFKTLEEALQLRHVEFHTADLAATTWTYGHAMTPSPDRLGSTPTATAPGTPTAARVAKRVVFDL